MKSFVLRIDPSTCDLERPATSTSPPPNHPSLKQLWNNWNGKAHKLLEQDTRIENLFWRRWYHEQKHPDKVMYSNPQFVPPYPGMQQYHSPLIVPPPVPNPNSHFERINEAGRQASRDLEAFLSNTLHNAQPPIIPNPPTFPLTIPPSPYSQLRQNLTNASPSPSVPHSHIVAPQPYRPAPFAQLPHQYQPSPEWAYNSLPPTSMPPPLPPNSSAGGNGVHQNRIIATPSWTALISDPSPQIHSPLSHQQPQPAAANYYPPIPSTSTSSHHHPSSLPSHFNPHPHAPHPSPNPHVVTSNPYSYFSNNSHHHPSLHTPSFTLPPSATLFTDLPSALSSTPALQSGGTSLSFYSSYGSYQPIITPYPRFLTPSPEPSILGELELELAELDHHANGGTTGGGVNSAVDYESVIGMSRGGIRGNGTGGGGDDELGDVIEEDEGGREEEENDVTTIGGENELEMNSVWKDFNRVNGRPSKEGGGSRKLSFVGSVGNGDGASVGTMSTSVGSTSSSSTGYLDGSAGGGGGGNRMFSNSAPTASGSGIANGTGTKRDPFEGMSLAQIRSRANSLEAVDRDAARYESFGVGSGLEPSDRAAFEVRDRVDKGKEREGTKGKRKNERGDGGAVGKKNKNVLPSTSTSTSTTNAQQDSFLASSPSTVESTSPTLTGSAEEASPNFDPNSKNASGSSSNANGSKKNRNPHATQLPGNGQRKLPKEEAGEGHQGPICSHCGSITTPLWRRGPDDELLCNACGLYLKLHSKPRPKTFGKGAGGSKRSLNGAAAKAAASGVPPVCSNCACTSTPMWRVLEGKLSCNACSLYFKLHKVPRPASLAQKRAAAAAAKVNLASDANPPSTASSPGDRPSILTPSDTSSAPTPASTAATSAVPNGTGESEMITSPSTAAAPLQPAVMPPPHHPGSAYPPPPPHATSHAPPTWSMLATSTSPFQPAIALPGSDPNPFAQTSWGALAYQLVSAAAEEEAGGPTVSSGPGPGGGGGGGPS